jgi:hypothetical protein
MASGEASCDLSSDRKPRVRCFRLASVPIQDVSMNADSRSPLPKRPSQSPSNEGPRSSPPDFASAGPRRLFLNEPGWRIGQKIGSEKTYCFMMTPGQDFYHRLLDGEIFVSNAEERICLACAERRGLLSFEPKTLRGPALAADLDVSPSPYESGFDLKYREGDEA